MNLGRTGYSNSYTTGQQSIWEQLDSCRDDDYLIEELFEKLLKEERLIFPIIKNSDKKIETATNVIATLLRNVVKGNLGSIYELIKYNSIVIVPSNGMSVDIQQLAHKTKTAQIVIPYEIHIPEKLTLKDACFALYDIFKTALKGARYLDEPEEMYNWLRTTVVGRIFAKASTSEPAESDDEESKYDWALETFKYDVQGVDEEVNSSKSRSYIENPSQHNVNWTLKDIVENAEEYKNLREPKQSEGPRQDSFYIPQDRTKSTD